MPTRRLGVTELRRAAAIVFVAAVPFLFANCHGADVITVPGKQLTLGTWGGARSEVMATASSTSVTFQCTFGNFPGSIALDTDGRFSVQGTYNPYAGPVAIGTPFLAQLSGQVSGNTLTFAVATYDTVNNRLIEIGPATVVLGRTADFQACPVL